MNYIIIPEGIAADPFGNPLPLPSFVYRQVIDYALILAHDEDTIFLAPANAYGDKTEHELAYEYAKTKKPCARILYPPITSLDYIDTLGNATHLKDFLGDSFSKLSFDLICAYIHSYRAEYCFKKVGFKLNAIHRVHYKTIKENIVSRWWYYKYKPAHIIYEVIAFLRDYFIIEVLST